MAEDSYPVRWTGRRAVVPLPEHVDLSSAARIREQLLAAISRGATELIADMTSAVSCDHAGAGAVARAYRRAAANGTQLRLVVTAPAVRLVLTLNGLDQLIPVYSSLAAATAAAAAPTAQAPVTPGPDGLHAARRHKRDGAVTGQAGMTSPDRPGRAGAVPRHPVAAGHGAASVTRSARAAGDPILAAKLTVPDVPDWAVPRPQVTRLIAEGARCCPLTVLTGPPGAGKTMALALWAAAEPGPVAWVSLDKFDNQPEVFWSYVVAALRRSGVTVPRALPAAGRDQEADHLLVLRLAAVLAAQDPPVMLVLDDLHLLAEPQLLKGLDFVLRNAGGGLRLAVASRADPLLPLHQYRVAGQPAEIRVADLAFTAAEAALLREGKQMRMHTAAPGGLSAGWSRGHD